MVSNLKVESYVQKFFSILPNWSNLVNLVKSEFETIVFEFVEVKHKAPKQLDTRPKTKIILDPSY